VAACEIAFGAKIWSTTPQWWQRARIKQLASAMKPRSWKRTKLTT
jgi:hypothetical protein